MSDIENRKIQDVLREVADNAESQSAYAVVQRLCREVGVIEDDESSYCEDLRDCLREIADRVDRHGVVEVRVPGATCEKAGRLAQRLRVIAEDEGWTLKAIIQKALGVWYTSHSDARSDAELARMLADEIEGLGASGAPVADADMSQARREVAARIREIRPDAGGFADAGGFVKALSDALGLPWVVDGGNQQRLAALRERLAEMVESAPLDDPCAQLERQHALPAGMVREAVRRLAMGEPYAGPAGAAQVLADFYGITQGEVIARLKCNVAPIPTLGDGAACRLGDEIEAEVNPGEWERGTLDGIGRDGDVLVGMEKSGSYWLAPDKVRRAVRPRTIDDILAEVEDAGCDDEPERILALVREAYELGRGECDE